MIESIYENLFQPASDDEVEDRMVPVYKLIDQFMIDTESIQVPWPHSPMRMRGVAPENLNEICWDYDDKDGGVWWQEVYYALKFGYDTQHATTADLVNGYRKWKEKQ